jgi:hypothetical protein
MKTEPTNDSTEQSTASGITRRSFIKRTTATAAITVLALHSFRHEAMAQEAASSNGKAFELMTVVLTEKQPGGSIDPNPSDFTGQPHSPEGVISQLIATVTGRLKNNFERNESWKSYNPFTHRPDYTGCPKVNISPVEVQMIHNQDGSYTWWVPPGADGNGGDAIRTITITYCVGFVTR